MKVDEVAPAVIRAARRAIEPQYAASIVLILAAWPVRSNVEVGTACIYQGGKSFVIDIDPAFAKEHLKSDDDALALIGHELNHALRGHFGLLPCRSPSRAHLQNLALDMLVNAIVARRLVGPPVGMLRRMYPLDAFPSCLLRPPIDLEAPFAAEGASREAWLAVLDKRGVSARTRLRDLARAHLQTLGVRQPDALARLWIDGWVDTPEPGAWWERFQRVLAAEGPQWEKALAELQFLGNHKRGRAEPGLGDMLGAEWGPGGDVELQVARPVRDDSAWRRFLGQVRDCVDETGRSRRGLPSVADATVMPTPGRRDTSWLALGAPPVLYHPTLPDRRDGEGGVHLYLDMSGSTGHLHGLFLGLAQILADDLALPAWAFGTTVEPITADDLRRGRFRTSGGTDILPVVEHASKRGVRRVIIVTEGHFHCPNTLVERVKKSGIAIVILIPPGHMMRWLRRLGTVLQVPAMASMDLDIPF